MENRRLFEITWGDASYDYARGCVSDRNWHRYKFVHMWASARHSGIAGNEHERFYRTRGKDAYWNRINRVRRAAGMEMVTGYDTAWS